MLISRWLGNCGKEVYGFPDGHLMERTRGMCPRILALANTRIALRSWREDSGDITRILLTAVADPLARQGARMSDTITLCTRILLTTQDLHSKRMDHGGSTPIAWIRSRSSYRLYLRMTAFGRFIKLLILLIIFIVYLITAISFCPIGIDLDRPYILFSPSFVNLKPI